MIVIADAGPLLHLHWVGAADWGLPQQSIHVVAPVWQEVARYAPEALMNARLRRDESHPAIPAILAEWRLDDGELAALALALSHLGREELLVLCDERQARRACAALKLPVTGSIGLIVEACRAGRVDRSGATGALRDLPDRGRLRVASELVERAVAALPAR